MGVAGGMQVDVVVLVGVVVGVTCVFSVPGSFSNVLGISLVGSAGGVAVSVVWFFSPLFQGTKYMSPLDPAWMPGCMSASPISLFI